ncbi:DUF5598 domain-containing protein [Candidatus Woesearchaeota archaeon]|nr:DUF5598 domain-containing protein [Candidatus Woesearchaeota archaeon]
MNGLPLAKTEEQFDFWQRLQPVNRVAASDTYKRTMSGSSDLFADNFACYTLAARKPLAEDGANGRYIMAGLEKMLYPWFVKPVTQKEVEKAQHFFEKHGAVKKFPAKAWQTVLDNGGYFPLDIYSLPGGQTFLAKDGQHVPMMSVEGPGALVSHLEPHLEQIFAPVIQATKARLMYEVAGEKFAEFGLRSDQNENNHVALMMALYVGGGLNLTSDDQAVCLFPEYFRDVGTMGHEFIMAYQRSDRSLEEAQQRAYHDFVEANNRSALLPDIIHTQRSGLPAIVRLIKEYAGTEKVIMPRLDSGDVPGDTVLWKKMTLQAGVPNTTVVVEDGYSPDKARQTKEKYAAAGFDPEDIIVGAGGYFQEDCHRDAASIVYKRSATQHESRLESSLKFSDTPGKESIPGRIRIYGRDRMMIVAQEGEEVDGIPLMQKVVSNGRIVYNEDLHRQHQRADETWNQYTQIEYSPKTQALMEQRRAERQSLLDKYVTTKKFINETTGRKPT